MSQPRCCPKCRAELPADAPQGLCPKCLLQAAWDSQSEDGPNAEHPQAGASNPATDPTRLTASGFVPPSPESLAPLFPQLEILELLGKGGMGAVYKARQPGLDRLVAVKILPPEISHDPAFTERFQREARALARLSHPHIVAVYDFGQTGQVRRGSPTPPKPLTEGLPSFSEPQQTFGRPEGSVGDRPQQSLCYIVMEFVDGANLRQTIQTSRLTSQEALAIVPQICEALQFAHDEGIVHRDIKPENILIDKRGRVKIADFGLAKLLGVDAGDHSLTATHQVMGTLRYMAPEQMQGSREVDHRADIYSLGVVFYELLTGELPMGKFAPPSKRVQVDVRLDEVVLRALEQDPELRYQHASDVKSEIDSIRTTPAPPKPVEQPNPLEPFREAARFAMTPNPSYAKRVGIPLAILFGLFSMVTMTAHSVYGQKDNYQEQPLLLIIGYGASLFWVAVIILHITFFARRRESMKATPTPFDDSGRAIQPKLEDMTPNPTYAKRVGIPSAILLGLFLMVTTAAHSVYGQKDNYQEQPLVLILSNGAILFWVAVIILHITFFARRRVSMKATPTPFDDSGRAIQPLAQMRFLVAAPRDIAHQAVFHFSSLGYELVEQQPEVCVFQRGGQWAGLWETDIRKIATRLTVRTAPATDGQLWVSCDWSVRTMGAWITRSDTRKLEVEGEGFKSLLGVAVSPELQPADSLPHPRFSRFAIAGAVWALFGVLAVIPTLFFIGLNRVWNGTTLPTDLIHEQPPLAFTIFMGALLAIGAGAPIGTTIYGAISIGHIKRSGGKVVGLPLAVLDVLFFPLLAVFAGIAVPVSLALHALLPFQMIAVAVPSAMLALVVCLVIGFAVWCKVIPDLAVTSITSREKLRLAGIVLLIAGIADAFSGLVWIGHNVSVLVELLKQGAPIGWQVAATCLSLGSVMLVYYVIGVALHLMTLEDDGDFTFCLVIAAIAPPGCLIGLPAAIYAFMQLTKPEVKALIPKKSSEPQSPTPPREDWLEKATPDPISLPSAALPPKRPKLVPVLATFNLVGAILLMLVCAMEEPAEFAKSMPRLWQVWEQVDAVLGFSMAAGLFAASIGLYLWKPWARKVTLGVCLFGLASFVFDAPYLARFAIPDAYAEIRQMVIAEGVDPDAQEFVALFTVVCLFGGMLVVVLTWLIGQLVYFTRPRVVAAFESQGEKHGKFIEWLFTGAGAVVGVLSVFAPLALLLGVSALFNGVGGDNTVNSPADPSVDRAGSASDIPTPDSSTGWIVESRGPVLTDVFARAVLKLQPEQIKQVNEILQAAHRDGLEIEQQHTEQHTDDAGHIVVRINLHPGPIEKLEDRLWSQLDAILDHQQQSVARLNLKLDVPEVQPPIALSELVRPGFFGWGKLGAHLEIWRVGTWYHWKFQSRGYQDSSRAPQLPEGYRRFWKEPDRLTRVTGIVTLDGQPLPDAEISFHGADELRFDARTDPDGRFLIAAPNQGRFPPGDYRVTIAKPGLREVYASPTSSGLTVKVGLGSNELNFDLSSRP